MLPVLLTVRMTVLEAVAGGGGDIAVGVGLFDCSPRAL